MLLFFCEVFLLVISSSQVPDPQCSFDNHEGKIQACGAGRCEDIVKVGADHRVLLINPSILDFNNVYYDVHAYRLCGDDRQASEVTLADAIWHGQLCQERRRSELFRNIFFKGCADFFNEGSNKDLTIYAYNNQTGCNGDLFYRFLLINGTGRYELRVIISQS